MSNNDDLFLSLQNKLQQASSIPINPSPTSDDLLCRLLETNSTKQDSPIPNKPDSDGLISRLQQNLQPKTIIPTLEQPNTARLASSNIHPTAIDGLLNSIRAVTQKANAAEQERIALNEKRIQQENVKKQEILDAQYAELQQEIGQINDTDLLNLAFDELVGLYNSLSEQKKSYIISRIEQVHPSAVNKTWFGKTLVSTDYITRLFDTDEKKAELILALSVYS
jgi:hypothetical protein